MGYFDCYIDIWNLYIYKEYKIYSVDQLYSEIADIDPKIEHPFNIVVIRDSRENGSIWCLKVKMELLAIPKLSLF